MEMTLGEAEVQFLGHLIDLRDSADLAGHRDAVFQFAEHSGDAILVAPPGTNVMHEMPARTIARLRKAGLIETVQPNSFDLVPNARDRLEALKAEVGKPTLLGQAQAELERARARVAELEAHTGRAAQGRQRRREGVAALWGGRARRLARGAAIAIYVLAVVLPLALGLPAPISGVLLVAGAVLQVLDWAFGRDGNGIANAVGRMVELRVLAALEAVSEGDG